MRNRTSPLPILGCNGLWLALSIWLYTAAFDPRLVIRIIFWPAVLGSASEVQLQYLSFSVQGLDGMDGVKAHRLILTRVMQALLKKVWYETEK